MFLLAWTSMSTGVWQQKKTAQIRLDLRVHIPKARRCTWPAGVGAGGRRRSLRFNYSFLLFLTRSHQSASQRGAERSQRSLHPGSAAATRSSGLQKNCDSLWHMLRCSIISLSLSLPSVLSHARSLALVRSVFTGTCKITWQEQLKALDGTDVPQRPANFYKLFSFIKTKSSVRSGSASASQRVSYYWKHCKVSTRFNINLYKSNLFPQQWLFWFESLNMLKPSQPSGCASLSSCCRGAGFQLYCGSWQNKSARLQCLDDCFHWCLAGRGSCRGHGHFQPSV